MCGIAGLLLRDPALEEHLGRLVVPMLGALDERGPDSAGLAVFHDGVPDRFSVSLLATQPTDWSALSRLLAEATGRSVTLVPPASAVPAGLDPASCAHFEVGGEPFDTRVLLAGLAPSTQVIGWGRSVEVLKDIGRAAAICARHGTAARRGYLAVGHTRMATESAVTAAHSHPFVPASDLVMVHNGSFSNHASVRRRLEAAGVGFETDNDSEVAARHLASHLGDGDTLEESVRWLMKDLDGFFTLLVATPTEMSVVRDAFACKPVVVAETDRYVAVASEYRALAGLPGIDGARVFEPQPEEVHTWTR